MITKVHIENYRSLRDVTVELGPLTVLVGKNGSGKSNFLDALWFVREALTDDLGQAINSRGAILHLAFERGGQPDFPVSFDFSGAADGVRWRYEFALAMTPAEPRPTEEGYRVAREALSVGEYETTAQLYEARDGRWVQRPDGMAPAASTARLVLPLLAEIEPFGTVLRSLNNTGYFSAQPRALPWFVNAVPGSQWEPPGAEFARDLDRLLSRPDARAVVLRELAAVLGFELEPKVERSGPSLVITMLRTDPPERNPLPAPSECGGAVRVLETLVGLYQAPPLAVAAFEEPESGLHPGALAQYCRVFERASSHVQIVIASHSPDLISCLEDPNAIRVVQLVDGETKIDPLDEVNLSIINDQLFSAGDLLRINGLDQGR